MNVLDAAMQGLIVGVFSGGAVWGVLRAEIRFMRRDIDEVRHYIWPERACNHGNKKKA